MIKGVKYLKYIEFIVKAWKLGSITTLNELCSVCKKCSIFSNLGNGTIQCNAPVPLCQICSRMWTYVKRLKFAPILVGHESEIFHLDLALSR